MLHGNNFDGFELIAKNVLVVGPEYIQSNEELIRLQFGMFMTVLNHSKGYSG